MAQRPKLPEGSVKCPDSPLQSDSAPHAVIGCGAIIPDDRDHEGLVDCPECGIFFDPDLEPSAG